MQNHREPGISRRDFIAAATLMTATAASPAFAQSAPVSKALPRERDRKMARVFITGSTSGLGLLAGRMLVEQGHAVVLHARDIQRADATRSALPGSQAVVIGDVSTLAGIRLIAEQVNALGRFDAVIHNVGIGDKEPARVRTVDGLSQLFAINVVAPYLLTALITRPDRLIYLSSSMHNGGDASLKDLQWDTRAWNGSQAYSDSKLHDQILAMGVARRWPSVLSNSVEPGWVPTRMGGASAPDDLSEGAFTQAWLAVSNEPAALVTGQNFHHRQTRSMHAAARNTTVQDQLFEYLAGLTGARIA